MNVYMYQGELYCEDCGQTIRKGIFDAEPTGLAPDVDPDDESTYDSRDYPKGPYPDGGGVSEVLEHCASCGVSLDNWVYEQETRSDDNA